MKIYLAQINTVIGDLDGNVKKILAKFYNAEELGCDLVVFPEMTISGYPCEDLWQKKYFNLASVQKISEICVATKGSRCAILLGAVTIEKNRGKKEIFYNSALIIAQGEVKKIINKKNLPSYGVFDEKRYFMPSPTLSLVELNNFKLAILICEDLWDLKNLYLLQEKSLDALIVVNSSPYSASKCESRQKLAVDFAKNLGRPLIYVNQVGGQDSLAFDGNSFVLNGQGEKILQLKGFAEDSGIVELAESGAIASLTPFIEKISNSLNDDYSACVLGLRDYIGKNGFEKVLVGMSGGIDSALVATIAVDALGSKNVALYALPSSFNPESSMVDAKNCANNLGINLQMISIEPVFEVMKLTLKNHIGGKKDIVEENLQSRIRGNILMALANDSGALLLTTGNKSELAMGYATIYGDMCGSFNPIKDLYKTKVYQLANYRNQNIPEISLYPSCDLIPQTIITKEPSAELRPNQKDSDSLPEYEILDKILYGLIEEQKSVMEIAAEGFDEELVKKVARNFYASEYKRRQSAIGVKVSNMAFDKDRRYPITSKFWC